MYECMFLASILSISLKHRVTVSKWLQHSSSNVNLGYSPPLSQLPCKDFEQALHRLTNYVVDKLIGYYMLDKLADYCIHMSL